MKKYFEERIYITALIFSIMLACLGDMLCRGSITKSIIFNSRHPLIFLLNALLIFLSFLLVGFIKRKLFYIVVITVIWLLIEVVNGIILIHRNTPFTFQDLNVIKAGVAVLDNYLSKWSIALIILLFAALLAGLIFCFFELPKSTVRDSLKKNLIISGVSIIAYILCYHAAIASGMLEKRIVNLNLSYKAYGVPYCFTVTAFDHGIDCPVNYSKYKIEQIKRQIPEDRIAGNKPNIIYLQMESFFDVKHIKGLRYSEDPVPTFTKLREIYSSGFFKVPAYGAGTINTEFEVLTGMNHNYFGAGEYPYKSVLLKNTCESINYNLKKLGYKTHAIHNNNAAFYDRHIVFGNLGFDTFTSEEYMNIEDYTESGWAFDKVLTDEILKALNSTNGPDFIQAISVQGHGEYPANYELKAGDIEISGMEDDISRKNRLTYYIQQIHQMDQFLKILTDQLSKLDEDVILVIYGDHLPSLDFKKKQLDNNSIYETEYVIWNNMNLQKEDEDIEAYQLNAKVLGQIQIQTGLFTKYHQQFKGTGQSYYKNMKLLEYDALYGKQYIYDGINPFKATDLIMGTNPIKIENIVWYDNGYMIYGKEFTKYSHLLLNGKDIKTMYIDAESLWIENISLQKGDELAVSQVASSGKVMSTSPQYIY